MSSKCKNFVVIAHGYSVPCGGKNPEGHIVKCKSCQHGGDVSASNIIVGHYANNDVLHGGEGNLVVGLDASSSDFNCCVIIGDGLKAEYNCHLRVGDLINRKMSFSEYLLIYSPRSMRKLDLKLRRYFTLG